MNDLNKKAVKSGSSNSSNTGYKKYRFLIVSLSLFSMLVVSIMMLSLYVSNQLEKDTKIINTAFEQTSLLNKTISELYIINGQYNTGQASSFAQNKLQKSTELLNARFLAFKDGGALPVVSIGKFNKLDTVTINAPSDPELARRINDVWPLWQEFQRRTRPALNPSAQPKDTKAYFNKYQFYGSVLHDQGAISGLSRLGLRGLTDQFALLLQQKSDKQVTLLRAVQIAGIIITALSLVLILFFIVRQLRRSDSELENAREEARGILNTVQEGLFLVHKDRAIGSEYSNELESILGIEDIAGRDISEVMENIISAKDVKNIDIFLNSLFNPKVVAKLIMSLNPLKELHVQIDNLDGTIQEKYLSFSFYRVTKSGVISDILISVKDITDKILLQNKLEITENKNEEQVKTLIALMKINANTLKLFLSNSTKSLGRINKILKEQVSGKEDFNKKINDIFVHIHTIKGEASAVNLKIISEKAHIFEDELEKLKTIENLDGMSFLPLTVQLEYLISYVESLSEISQKMYGLNAEGASQTSPTNKTEWNHLKNLAAETAKEYKKKAYLVTSGLSEIQLNDQRKQQLNAVFVHLIKNSLVHGIELPSERLSSAKPGSGRIDISAVELPNGGLEINVRDDGRGIDSRIVARKLVDKGIASEVEIANWSSTQINKHIFSSGFSTANVDMNAGRGVGLRAVYEMVKTMGGNLKVKQQVNKYCQFSIYLPPSA
jgi:signal transduction histidine kinase